MITIKHQKIRDDYESVKREHLKYLKKKVLAISNNVSIFRDKKFDIKINKFK